MKINLPSDWRLAVILRLCLAFALTMGLTGCFVPMPHTNTGYARSNVGKRTPEQFTPGQTTREDMILQLGEPDAVSLDEREFAYREEKLYGLWAVGIFGAGTGGPVYRNQFWIFKFDSQGRWQDIAKFTWHSMLLQQPHEAALNSTGFYFANTNDTRVVISRSGFWLPDVDGFRSKGFEHPMASSDWLPVMDNPMRGVFLPLRLVPLYRGTPGEFVLTESNLVFSAAAGFADAEPVLKLPLASIVRAGVATNLSCQRLVIHTDAGKVHSFEIYKSNVSSDRPATRAARDFLQTKIKPSASEE
jgi:hypothetical protein